nr:hypothetical protein [Tanacetum cinerariifolium]
GRYINNPTPLEAKDHFEIVINSNDDIYSSDDDSLYNENIEYVEASPHDSKIVSLEATEIVIPKVKEIEEDNLREKLLNVHLLIANIEALKDNPTLSSMLLTKSSSTSPKSFLEETNTFHNSLSEFENFCFDLEEISSGSTTTDSDISLLDYEFFYFNDDDIEEISGGSTTTHSYVSLSEYVSFIFDLANDQLPPTDMSDLTHEEFADELAHIISPPEYDCFYFRNLPDPGELISIVNSKIHENPPSTTRVDLPIEDDYSPLLTYVVWIFLAYLTYPVIPPYLHSFGNEDTIFDPGITINRFCSFKHGLSHWCGAFNKFNTHRSHLNEWPMIINGKNTPILDVLLLPPHLLNLSWRRLPLFIILCLKNFCFDLEEISSGSTTTHSDISLSEYEAFSFYDDHIEEIRSGSTTTQSDISLPEYDSFIFDLSNDQFPPTDRSAFTHEGFGDEPNHIISPPEYDCFYFRDFPNLVKDDYFPLLAYVVWIFLAYLTYPIIPLHLHSFRNEDTIFDPGITINHFYSFKPGLSHRCGTFREFNTHRSHLNESPMETLLSTLFPIDQ